MKNCAIAVLLLTLLGSCGTITRARYGNGLGFHIETSWGSRKETKTDPMPQKRTHIRFAAAREPNSPVPLIRQAQTDAVQNDAGEFASSAPKKPSKQPVNDKFRKKIESKVGLASKALIKVRSEEKTHKDKPEMDTTSAFAGFFFYGSLLALYLLLAFSEVEVFLGILILGLILGLILAVVGLSNVVKANREISGYTLDMSIILVCMLSIFVMIISIGPYIL